MARILAYTSPARGHLFPATAILLELQRHGHEVAVRTLASEVPTMVGLGFDASAVDPAIESIRLDDYEARTPVGGLARATAVFAARAQHEVPDLRAAIQDVRPDAVLVDVNSWGAAAAAAAWGGAWGTFCPYPMALDDADVPPYGPGLAPARGPAGRVRDRLVRRVVMGAIEKQTLPPVNALRADLGLAPLSSADDVFTSPPLVLYLTAEPFEYHRKRWPDNILMVGPCDWEPATAEPAWLANVEGPVVLVTTSSEYQDDAHLVSAAVAGLADEPVTVVATLPSGQALPGPLPRNALAVEFTPHGPLLDRAVCAVTHGGMGATQKALSRGVPVVTVPFGRDQLEVAARAVHAGAGVRLSPRRLSPERLRAAVTQAQARRAGARAVADGYVRAGGAAAAAAAVDRRLLGRTGPRVS